MILFLHEKIDLYSLQEEVTNRFFTQILHLKFYRSFIVYRIVYINEREPNRRQKKHFYVPFSNVEINKGVKTKLSKFPLTTRRNGYGQQVFCIQPYVDEVSYFILRSTTVRFKRFSIKVTIYSILGTHPKIYHIEVPLCIWSRHQRLVKPRSLTKTPSIKKVSGPQPPPKPS